MALQTGAFADDTTPAGGDGFSMAALSRDPSFEDVLSRSFETILSDSQRLVYTAIDPAERSTYRRRFWMRCDPSPATDRNEFLEEHLQRLAYVLENFCPDGDHDWDARGEIALRFGLPSSRSRDIGDIGLVYGGLGLRPNSETWFYGDEEMVFEFIDPNMDRRYQLGTDLKYTTAHGRAKIMADARESIDPYGPTFRYMPPPVPVNVEGDHAAAQMAEMSARGQNAVEEVPLSFGYSPDKPPLPFFYEIVTARGRQGATDLAINYQVPQNALSFSADGGRPACGLRKELRVLDLDYDLVTSEARTVTVIREDGSDPSEGEMLTDEWRIDADPGIYIVGFCLEDTLSGRRGYGRSLVRVPGYSAMRLSMSDIQLARAVAEGSRFARMGGSVVPHPVHAFRRDEQMVIYFELYGLTEDLPGIGRFTVETEISGRNVRRDKGLLSRIASALFPQEQHSISMRVIGSGELPDTAYWYAIALTNLAEDNYDLTITVKDVRSEQVVSRKAAFTVLED